MPVLAAIRERFEQERRSTGLRIAACLHVTTETANLMRTLKAGGADVVLCASNPLSTQDDVAAALVARLRHRRPSHPRRGRTTPTTGTSTPRSTPSRRSRMDDGADVDRRHARHRRDAARRHHRRHRGDDDRRHPPARDGGATACSRSRSIAVNDAQTKHLFDNRYGTGQSTLDGIIRATNVLLAGRVFVVAGYGWCGRGLASRGARHGRPRDRDRGGSAARARGHDGRLRGACRWPRPRRSATSSAPRPATSTSSAASTSR